jgi:hypothetical protein
LAPCIIVPQAQLLADFDFQDWRYRYFHTSSKNWREAKELGNHDEVLKGHNNEKDRISNGLNNWCAVYVFLETIMVQEEKNRLLYQVGVYWTLL